MNIDDFLKEADKRYKKNSDYINELSEEERNELKKTELKISYKIKKLLDKKDIGVADITTYFYKNYEIGNDEFFDVFCTVYTSIDSQRARSIITNAETLEILYVRAGIKGLIPVKEYFSL